MSALVVDISSWISYFATGAAAQVIDEGLKDGRIFLPPVVAAELASGHIAPAKRQDLTDFLRELPLVGCDLDHWLRVGELRLKAAKKGLKISTPDAHVAQCCLDLGGSLLSEDDVFRKLVRSCPDLTLVS